VKFLPPEEEIRAQLRELTSQTRQLRADLQGLITRRGPSQAAFSHDHRYRLKPDPFTANDYSPSSADDHSPPSKDRASKPAAEKRRSSKPTHKPTRKSAKRG
jgi:hypothetical protein